MSQNPQIGITAVFDAAAANKAIAQHQAQIARLEKQMQRIGMINLALNNSIAKSAQTRGKVEKKVHDDSLKQLKAWRRNMIAVLFFARIISKVFAALQKNMEEAREALPGALGARALAVSYDVDLGSVIKQLQEVSKGTLSVEQAFEVALKGILADQGQFVDEYASLWEAARVAAVTAGVDAVDAYEAMIQALAEGSGEILDSTTNIYQAELALTKYAQSMGTTVDALDPAVRQQIILNEIYDKTNDLLASGADDALAAAEGINAAATAFDNLKRAVGVIQNIANPLNQAAELVNKITTAVMHMGAAWAASGDIIKLSIPALLSPPLYAALRLVTAIDEALEGAAGRPSPAFAKRFEQIKTAMGQFGDVVDPTGRIYERLGEKAGKAKSLDSIVDHILKREELMQDHFDKLDDINDKYDARREKAAKTLVQREARIRRQATRDRTRAERDYNQQVDRADRKFYLDKEHDLQDHLRKQRQEARTYHLDRLHDEALYQYERGLLVAEGDVLAIEDLDARQQLERDKEEDNFQIRNRHTQQDFDAEQRQTREQHELRLAIMEEEFQQRIDEIAVLERERLNEAQERYDEELEMAKLAWQQQRDAEHERHAESLRDWNWYWGELADQTELGAKEITDIINAFFGPGSRADSIIASFIARFERIKEIRKELAAITGRSTSGQEREIIRQGRPTGSQTRWDWLAEHQYGGSGIVNRPTLIPVGAGHAPERYSVQPISQLGGNISIGWSGGAIPITGSGLEGADLSGMGDAIAQGIVIAMQQSFVGS